MGPPTNILPENLLQDFDADLQEFYSIVIRKELKYKDKRYVECIRQAITEIVEAYKKGNTSTSSSALRFSTKEKRCGYILKHSPCFTSAVAFHFMNFITDENNRDILDAALQKGQLSICCLGGGPASEIVAILKILGPLYLPYWTQTQQELSLKVTIIDINEDWKTTCEMVLECLRWFDAFDGVNAMKFDFHFIQADLSKPMCDDVKATIRNADILTMVYFVSAVNGGKDKEESFNMVKNIMETMKSEGILFFLDSATDVHYEQMDRAARELGDMSVVYKPCIEYLHCLSLESVKKFLDTYKALYNKYICMTNSFMSYCIWRKTKQSADNEKEQITNKSAMKNSEELTEKMQCYRRQVKELCNKELGLQKFDSSEKLGEAKRNQTDTLENYSETELKIVDKTSNWRENRTKEVKRSGSWREKGPQEDYKYRNYREIGLKNLERSENYRDIDPKRSENWRERNDSVSKINSNSFVKCNPQSVLTNNSNTFDEQNQNDFNPKNSYQFRDNQK